MTRWDLKVSYPEPRPGCVSGDIADLERFTQKSPCKESAPARAKRSGSITALLTIRGLLPASGETYM